ncbi:hypothetical protein ccbrp13_54420 [Ktedonobacteria bacterium brp13]|nr:hypothetical protein ccbrp13_54420 [Ktedonobacteria bacterium brp13]
MQAVIFKMTLSHTRGTTLIVLRAAQYNAKTTLWLILTWEPPTCPTCNKAFFGQPLTNAF